MLRSFPLHLNLCIYSFIAFLFGSSTAHAQEVLEEIEEVDVTNSVIVSGFEKGFTSLVHGLETVLFYEIIGFPAVVLWLILGGVYFTLRLGFINIRMFGHALKVVTNHFHEDKAPGEISPFAALSAAVSGTVGLGNIAGVAAAVTMGGPGAVVWMMVAGVLGMSTKFAEALLGLKYRKIDEEGRVSGGAFYYLRDGLAENGKAKLGKILAVIFAVLWLCGSFGGGNMFQSNQTVAALTNTFSVFSDMDWVIALVIACAVGVVLLGGVKRIASVAEAIVPLMALVYISASLIVLGMNIDQLDEAIATMFSMAFSLEAGMGGMMGAMITGFRRAAFSNEAGVGSGPIVMSAMRTNEPTRAGCLGLLEPCIDTIIICFITGTVITVTGVYTTGESDGVMLTSRAFGTAIELFPMVLSVCVALFAFSTMITWSYYGERAWSYMFGHKRVGVYHILFCMAVFFGGIIDFGVVLSFSDLMILAMSVPNLIGLYLLQNKIVEEVKDYRRRMKAGEFVRKKDVIAQLNNS